MKLKRPALTPFCKAMAIVMLLMSLSCDRLNFLFSGCENRIIQEIVSPNSVNKAVVFTCNCGAMSSLATQLSIIRKGNKLPNDYGNVFQCDTRSGKVPSLPDQGAHLEIKWLSDNELLVVYDPLCRTGTKNTEYKGIRIRYETHAWTEDELMKMQSGQNGS
jgi:hypothetical protein